MKKLAASYGAHPRGDMGKDAETWMANDLGDARPGPDSDAIKGELYTRFSEIC